jgi:diguanylate cyclase (GGDEF)-like protein/PAS domain S-box-containing protein
MNTAPDSFRVLVIDDNAAIHQDFGKIFGAGKARAAPSAAEAALFGGEAQVVDAPEFRIDVALQGEEGLALVRQARAQGDPYSVAFIDVRMPPGWDGIETTSRIWDVDPDLQVVICTAYSDYSWSEMIAKLGRCDRLVILKKPFDTIEVLQLASALTEKWRLARASREILGGLERRVAERTLELAMAGDELRASENQYRLLFDSNPHPMWVYDIDTLRFVLVNQAAVESYGYSREEFLAMTIREIRPPEDRAMLDLDLEDLQGQGKKFGQWRHCTRDGTIVDVEVSSDRMVFGDRRCRLVLAHDVTQRLQAEHRVKRLNRVHSVLGGINSLIVRATGRDELFREACAIAVNKGLFRMAWIGIVNPATSSLEPIAAAGEVRNFFDTARLSVLNRVDGFGLSGRAVRDCKTMVSNDVQRDPAIILKAELAERGVRSVAVIPLLAAGAAVGVIALYSAEIGFFDEEEMRLLQALAGDISFAVDHIDKQERLNYLARYDVLTGLANRGHFLDRLAQWTRSAAGGGHKLALCMFDLERFKNINDTLGTAAGDALLRQVAAWAGRTAGDDSLVARVGADQFAIVMPKVLEAGDVARVLEGMLQDLLDHPFHSDDGIFRIAAKIGVALYPEDGAEAGVLFRNAEAALKKAKAKGDRYMFYTQKMTETVAGKLSLENQLRHALDEEEFVLHYQPKINLASGAVIGAEALIRWNDPRTGLVPPGRFIPVLEETGLIYDVGRWALGRALRDYLAWLDAGLGAVRIAVNVSPLQLRNRGFVDEVGQLLQVDVRAAAGLELEITESVIMDDAELSIATLQQIRGMGLTIAIDDFGTGYSSLSYLAKLPVDTLKIDRSFVVEAVTPGGLALVGAIVSLAHSLRLNVIAEGVETEAQSGVMLQLGCDEAQGYLFGKPVPGADFAQRFLARAGAREAALT